MSAIARKRWDLLASNIRSKKKELFSNSIFTYDNFYYKISEDKLWVSVFKAVDDIYLFDLTFTESISSLNDLIGFNNTGNTQIWPSEEMLSIYLQNNEYLINNVDMVCELGGGMTCFSSLLLNVKYSPKFILLTDGNSRSVKNLEQIVTRNSIFSNCVVQQLLWNKLDNIDHKYIKAFDLILCCDCFFFTEYHENLIDCIDLLLKESGKFVACAPSRNETLEAFISKIENRNFLVNLDDNFEKSLTKNDSFANRNYQSPKILTLIRK